jgi:hypothetical protein
VRCKEQWQANKRLYKCNLVFKHQETYYMARDEGAEAEDSIEEEKQAEAEEVLTIHPSTVTANVQTPVAFHPLPVSPCTRSSKRNRREENENDSDWEESDDEWAIHDAVPSVHLMSYSVPVLKSVAVTPPPPSMTIKNNPCSEPESRPWS